MKAPDVIYANDYGIWYKTKPASSKQTDEYIRKDALLEWAEHHLENLNNINFSEDNYDAGKSHILSDLINKLKSMLTTDTIEKIKAEIEKRLKANGAFDEVGDDAWAYDQGLVDAYKSILSFIESLGKESVPKIKGWVARDKNNSLYLHWEKPHQILSYSIPVAWRGSDVMQPIKRLPDDFMPDLKFENDPIEVELIIKRV